GGAQARTQERADPHRHGHGPAGGVPDRRRDRGGDAVRDARARHLRHRRDHRPRLPAGAGVRADHRAGLRDHQPAGGPDLHLPRPPDQVRMMDTSSRPISGGSVNEAELTTVGSVPWAETRARRSETPLAQALRRLRKSVTALVGVAIVALLVLVAIFADAL